MCKQAGDFDYPQHACCPDGYTFVNMCICIYGPMGRVDHKADPIGGGFLHSYIYPPPAHGCARTCGEGESGR